MAVAPKILLANGAGTSGGGGVPLPSFSFPGMPIGFIVADSTGQNWQLTISSAAVDHTSVEKCAVNPALRWLTYSGGGGGGGITQLTSDVTAGPGTGSQAATIAAGAVTLAKQANLAANSVIGNNTGAPATPVALTQAQLTAMINAATSSLSGAQSATDKALSLLDWKWQQWLTMKSLIPQLTGFDEMKMGQNPIGTSTTAVTTDALVEGGGMAVAAATTIWTFGTSILQTPKTGKYAIAFRAKFNAPVAGQIYQIGLINGGHTSSMCIASAGTTSLTKYVLRGFGADVTGSVNADANPHDFMITADGTTLTFYVDGVSSGTQTQISYGADEALYPLVFNQTTDGAAKLYKFAYGYIQP